jgi:predicted NBD/HSP70 family sugar kinase
MSAGKMVKVVTAILHGELFDAISIGYPGLVRHGKPSEEPHHLAGGWTRIDFARAFKCPVRVVNDAAMQALGSYQGGRMLFLGFGTGLGSALIFDGVLVPMQLADIPYRNGRTYGDYVGQRGLIRLGLKRWRDHAGIAIQYFMRALQPEYVVIGGGNSRLLKRLPPHARVESGPIALLGGQRLWSERLHTS